ILGARWPPDVGGERHFPVLRERCTRIERTHKTHAPEPPTHATEDLSRAVVAEGHAPSRLELAARMSHRDPAAVGQLADEYRRAATRPRAARRQLDRDGTSGRQARAVPA